MDAGMGAGFEQALAAVVRDLRILEAAGNVCFALYRVEKLLGLPTPVDRPYSVDDLENAAPFDKLATDFERRTLSQ